MEQITEEKLERKANKRLSLTQDNEREGMRKGVRSNGKVYSVRDDRSRYFFPDEWNRFYNALREEKRPIFDVLINTGARIEEALNIKAGDFDWERCTLTLRVTKTKASKGERSGKKRSFVISPQFARRMRKYISENNLKEQDFLFGQTKQAVYQLMRRTLKNENFKDWYDFSLHNIRKTHGNWLKALDIKAEEICLRLGHDYNTYLRHYGSASIFDRKDKQLMLDILGEVYGLK